MKNVHHAAHCLVIHASITGDRNCTQISGVVTSYCRQMEGSFSVRKQEEGYTGIWNENEQTEGEVHCAHFSGSSGIVKIVQN